MARIGKCPRCGGSSYWEPSELAGKENVPGTYTCMSCSRIRTETDKEVLQRCGQEVYGGAKAQADKELNEIREKLKEDGLFGLSNPQVERLAAKIQDGSFDAKRTLKNLKSNATRRN